MILIITVYHCVNLNPFSQVINNLPWQITQETINFTNYSKVTTDFFFLIITKLKQTSSTYYSHFIITCRLSNTQFSHIIPILSQLADTQETQTNNFHILFPFYHRLHTHPGNSNKPFSHIIIACTHSGHSNICQHNLMSVQSFSALP